MIEIKEHLKLDLKTKSNNASGTYNILKSALSQNNMNKITEKKQIKNTLISFI